MSSRGNGLSRALVALCIITAEAPSLHAQDATNEASAVGAASRPRVSEASEAVKGAQGDGDVETARSHFKLGVDSYRDGDLTTALIEFKRAYAAAPNFRLLFNLGQVSRELRDYPEAERYFREYLTQGASQIDDARRQEVQNEIAKANARIASLVIAVNEPDAEVFVDDVPVGRAPLGDVVRVSAGQRRISATLAGRQRATEVVDAAGGETHVVKLDLQPLTTQVVTREVVRKVHVSDGGGLPAGVWLLGGGTLVLGAGAGVMAFLTQNQVDDYQAALQRRTSEAELQTLSDSAKAKALITDILLGASLACGVTTLVVGLTAGQSRRERPPPAKLGKVGWGVGPGALQLNGHF